MIGFIDQDNFKPGKHVVVLVPKHLEEWTGARAWAHGEDRLEQDGERDFDVLTQERLEHLFDFVAEGLRVPEQTMGLHREISEKAVDPPCEFLQKHSFVNYVHTVHKWLNR